jgi:hypothetical protein
LAPLIDSIQQHFDASTVSRLSQQLGIDEGKTRQALPVALTALLGGLARNAEDPAGAQQLAGALSRDHDGSVLDNLGGLFGHPGAAAAGGDGILGHVFGPRRPAVESNVGRVAGLDPATVSRLLMLLAPVVLGALGRRQRQQGLDQGGLSEVLSGERRHLERALPGGPGGLGGLGALLDADGDGHVMDDLAGTLGGLLGGRRT